MDEFESEVAEGFDPFVVLLGKRRPYEAEQGAIANDFMKDMDFTEDGGKAPARWVAVRHGLCKNGNDHNTPGAGLVTPR